jgi:hypothetical protein
VATRDGLQQLVTQMKQCMDLINEVSDKRSGTFTDSETGKLYSVIHDAQVILENNIDVMVARYGG